MLSALKKEMGLERFINGEGPKKAPYFLNHRRVFILPTRLGLGFAFVLFIMLISSTNYSSSLGYFFTFLLSSLYVVTMFHTYNNLLHLSIGPAVGAPVFANQPINLEVQFDNSDYQKRCAIRAFAKENERVTTDFDEYAVTTWSIPYRFTRRGLVSLPRFTLETTFPLGLFRAWAHVELEQRQLVYPEPLAQAELPEKNSGFAVGELQSNEGIDDFRNLRAYVAGDPLQHVHWKNYARHQLMQTKEFSSGLANGLWLDWQKTTADGEEQKLSQLTRWVMLANSGAIPFGLRLPNREIQPGSGSLHVKRCLKQLALYGSSPS